MALFLFRAEALFAQIAPDTTRADTMEVASPPTERGPVQDDLPPMRFDDRLAGEIVLDSIPARLPVWEPVGILERVPGSFVYAFGTPGWPDAWSRYGYRPEDVELVFQQLPFEDLVTGRPRYDLLPLGFLQPIRLGNAPYGGADGVRAALRAFGSPRPLTEIRYWTGANGLQSVEVLHAQNRLVSPFGRRGVLSVLGGYGGRASDGEYPGSQLRRERRLTGRIRFARPNWTFEILDLYNRHRIGAHAGVEPPIFQRIRASVINPRARRQTIRNDLSGTLRTSILGSQSPASFTAFWTAQSLLYDRGASNVGSDTVWVAMDRLGTRAAQDWRLGSHRLGLQVAGWRDSWNARGEENGSTRENWQLHAVLRDSVELGSASLSLEGGLHREGSGAYPSILVRLERPFGFGRVFASGGMTGRAPSAAERLGFGPVLRRVDDLNVSRIARLEMGLSLTGRVFDLSTIVFANQSTNAVDLHVVTGDTVQAFVSGEPVLRSGVALNAGWRREAERGFYATTQATFLYIDAGGAVANHAPLSESLPSLYGNGQFGARYVLFRGDLDLDVYLDGRYWTEMRSRTLHPSTGLLVLPAEDSRVLGPSGVLNFIIQAGVRTATFFIAWDNVLASSTGGGLYEGTLLVPDYPLPERRFRFGVYWPIQD